MAFESRSNVVDVYVRYLREKVDRPFGREGDRDHPRRWLSAAGRRRMSKLPIRLRLTLPFAVAMAAVLAATGAFVYLRVGGALLSSVDANLVGQAQEAVQRANADHGLVDPDASEGPSRRRGRAGQTAAWSRRAGPAL